MKRFFITALILLIPAISMAQETYWSVDGQISLRNGNRGSLVGVFTGHQFKDSHYGVWGFGGISPEWGEFLAGPSYNTKIKLVYTSLGFGVGIEQPNFTPRFAAFMLSESRKTSTMLFVEHGKGTGFWYFAYFVYKVTPFLGVGIYSQEYVGSGPQLKISKGPVYIWGGPMIEKNEWGTIFGAGLSF